MYKKIGIIGGLTPESTVSYYLHITRSYIEKFGDYSYPEVIIYSVNLENYHRWRDEDKWNLIIEDLAKASNNIQKSGADFGLIATNTMHKVFDEVQRQTSLPLMNLIDITVDNVKKNNIKKIGLLGTKFTMEQGFYKSKLIDNEIAVLTPSTEDQAVIHKIIVEELARGEILEKSKNLYLNIIDKLKSQGAEGVILGCTEIPLLIKQSDCDFPVIDTATIHAEAALLNAIK